VRVLVVGSGGREHALAWLLARDSEVDKVYAAPGNPGIAQIARCVEISATSIGQLASFAKKESVDLTVVGPEAPLSLGIVDAFRDQGLRIFGPDLQAARIESSKSFAKDLCSKFHIPTPRWETFTNSADARSALDRFGPPWVVKADGLAAGKGTTVTQDQREAESAVQRELQRDAGRVVLEEFVDGWEATFMATVSAGRVQWLTPVFQDYKPVSDGDMGPNTGGMGCYSPVPEATPSLVEKVERSILSPAVAAMEESGVHYQGLLNLNAIISNRTGEPYVLEFNARFGDPEAQGVAMLVDNGLAAHLNAVAGGSDKPTVPKTIGSACVVVVLASKGYPTSQSIGDKITIRPLTDKNVTIFHAGTARTPAGELVTAGGRVLNVAATGPTVESARRQVYKVIDTHVEFSGMQYRSDIGVGRTRRRNLQAPRSA
jgi:phosphoribosylamine--glycine ligase